MSRGDLVYNDNKGYYNDQNVYGNTANVIYNSSINNYNSSLHSYNDHLNPYNNSILYSNDSLHVYNNQSLQLYNFTLQQVVKHHAYPSVIIDRSITPIWYIIGLIGNSLSIAVWLQRKLRRDSSSAVYFAALSISDIIMLLLHMLQELNNAWDVNTLGYPVLCELYAVFYLAGQYLAPILVFCFTVDRYIAICFPFKKNKYCTPRQALKVVLLVVLLSVLLCAAQGYFWHYDPVGEICTLRDFFISNPTGNLWFHWTTTTESLIFFVIPVLNLVANVRVIKEIYKIAKAQQPPTTVITTRPRASSQQHHSSDPHKQQMVSSLRSKQLNNSQLLQQSSSLLGKLDTASESRSSLFVASGRTTCLSQNSGRHSYSVVVPKSSHHHHSQHHHTHGSHHGGTAVATNVMLLSVSFYVIFTTLPPAIIYAVETMYPEGPLHNTSHSLIATNAVWRRYFAFIHIKAVVYELCISHYACNIFIFILTGRKFRNAALSTFSCRKWQPEGDHYYGNSGNNNGNDCPNNNSICHTSADITSHIEGGHRGGMKEKV